MHTLQTFYDEHPINEGEILSKLAEQGKTSDNLEPEDLFAFDQDHYGATEATTLLAEKLGVTAESHVLDPCSGMGGTSRFLAHTYGCRVTGMDLTQSRTEGAERLTRMVGLDHLVIAVQGLKIVIAWDHLQVFVIGCQGVINPFGVTGKDTGICCALHN